MKPRYFVQGGILQDNAHNQLIALHIIMTTSCIDFYIH